MPTLYVDVVGTLINSARKPNQNVVDFIKKFKGNVVIWSGSGEREALRFGTLALGKTFPFVAKDKSMTNVEFHEGDVIIEDVDYIIEGLVQLAKHDNFTVIHPRDI